MSQRTSLWLHVIAVAITAAYVVPYLFFSQVDAWYGSFLFWIVVTLAVIVINARVSSRWRDE